MQKTELYKNGDKKGTIDARVHPSADGDGYFAEFSIWQDLGGQSFDTLFQISTKFSAV